jgi:hypothetical protein
VSDVGCLLGCFAWLVGLTGLGTEGLGGKRGRRRVGLGLRRICMDLA